MDLVTDEERAAVRRAIGITARRIAYRLRAIVTTDDPAMSMWESLAQRKLVVPRGNGGKCAFFLVTRVLLRAVLAPTEKMTGEVRRVYETP